MAKSTVKPSNETIKQYNNYLHQIEMILHTNLYNAFIKIHNKIIDEKVSEAKQCKPSKKWFELKELIERMNKSDKYSKSLYKKQIHAMIENMPDDKG